jgi:hypothetical protein
MNPAKSFLIPMVAAALSLAPAAAEAVTLKEIVQLSRSGLGDEVLLALIEVDQRVFAIDPDTLKMLKEQGVSERVIVALIRSGRAQAAQPEPPPEVYAPAPPEPEPHVVVIERERPVIREVAVAVPIYVPVVTNTRTRHRADRDPEPRKRAEPVYWGWGGKRRPDTWKESPPDRQKR